MLSELAVALVEEEKAQQLIRLVMPNGVAVAAWVLAQLLD
jgi:hypothetical protein